MLIVKRHVTKSGIFYSAKLVEGEFKVKVDKYFKCPLEAAAHVLEIAIDFIDADVVEDEGRAPGFLDEALSRNLLFA